jgi:hypothetical protein
MRAPGAARTVSANHKGIYDHVVAFVCSAAGGALRGRRRASEPGDAANSDRYIFGRIDEAVHAVVDPETPDLAVFGRMRLRFSDKQDDPTGSPMGGPALGLHWRDG